VSISKIHDKAINEYIDSVLDSEGLIYPFIDEEMERRIKKRAKEAFLAGYMDLENTTELSDHSCACRGEATKLVVDNFEKLIKEDIKNDYN